MNEMTILKDFYNNDKDFKEYVDKIIKTYGWTLDKALQSPITENYYKYLIDSRKDIIPVEKV